MCRLLRRLFVLALLAGAAYAISTALMRRRDEPQGDAPVWPPFDETSAATPAPEASPAADDVHDDDDRDDDGGSVSDTADTAGDAHGGPASSAQRWVEPVDGQCPDGFPIKGNAGSGIYHVPGGRFYDRTVPERCYANEDDATADGYRRSKA